MVKVDTVKGEQKIKPQTVKLNWKETGQRRGSAQSEAGEHEMKRLRSSVRAVGGGWQKTIPTGLLSSKGGPQWTAPPSLTCLCSPFHTESALLHTSVKQQNTKELMQCWFQPSLTS